MLYSIVTIGLPTFIFFLVFLATFFVELGLALEHPSCLTISTQQKINQKLTSNKEN